MTMRETRELKSENIVQPIDLCQVAEDLYNYTEIHTHGLIPLVQSDPDLQEPEKYEKIKFLLSNLMNNEQIKQFYCNKSTYQRAR